MSSSEPFKLWGWYDTLAGKRVQIIEINNTPGYETVRGDDMEPGLGYRYNRESDRGRCTGSPDDCPNNLVPNTAIIQRVKAEADAIGATVVPTRYAGDGRECIDLIRDVMVWWFGDKKVAMSRDDFVDGHDAFHGYCVGQVIRYRFRKGLKGPAEEDEAKAVWYERMALHVATPEKHRDPRSERPGFTPYVYVHPSDEDLNRIANMFEAL